MRIRISITALVIFFAASVLAAQSNEYVVVITGTKQFHQPTCRLVAEAGSHIKMMKHSEALRKGLTAHDCSKTPSRVVASDPNAVKVYTQPGDNKYHTATCPKLGSKRTTLTLEEAGKKLWPCPVCHPPIRQAVVKQ